MNRRRFLFAAFSAIAPFGAAHAERGRLGAAGFVETLYQKQARLLAEQTPLSQEQYIALFSRGMRRLMRAPWHFPKDMLFGPTLNAVFGWGVLPGDEIKLGKVDLVAGDDKGPATVSIEIEHRGEPHKVLVRLVSENGDWRIVNIFYDYSGRNLARNLADHYRGFTAR